MAYFVGLDVSVKETSVCIAGQDRAGCWPQIKVIELWHLIHHRRDQKLPRPPRGKDGAPGMAERQRMERERRAERLKSYRRGKGEREPSLSSRT